uniref:peptide-methionine (S)-S-oxide reductase n=1 Tax=Pseudo-nitzschia australis TaxID=44445 RepID=A0A7S4AVM6_9STRA|mmetsp:Transcript_25534/g.53211  ORF Transcript_25534/g.53211 Transcript_25534/m.53211 type:complete len:230 (-) Transcript_25534:398-1087(-)
MGSTCSKTESATNTPPTKPSTTTKNNNNNKNTNDNSNMAPITSTLALGAGCYWGTEKYIVKDFQKLHPGCIAKARVGFMNPDPNGMEDPSYRQVCSGSTGHVEVLNIELSKDAAATPELFEELMKFFYTFHDPTTLHRQGNDRGTQYGSAVFVTSGDQREIAERVKKELQSHLDHETVTGYQGKTVETAIVDYTTFYEAHKEHQEYLDKNPRGYCNHRYRFQSWPKAEL